MMVVLSGLPGTGKSELAAGLGRALRVPVLSVDVVVSALLGAGFPPGFIAAASAHVAIEALAGVQLDLGLDVIVDAVNSVDPPKAMWRRVAERHGAELRIIECFCSDPALHRRRLETRRRGLAENFPEPTWDEVEQRRLTYTDWGQPLLALDAVESSEANLARALEWLRR